MMNFDPGTVFQSLARCTRFNPGHLDHRELSRLPLAHGWNALFRGMIGLAHCLAGTVAMLLFPSRLAGAVVATVLVVLLHDYLTAGRERTLPQSFRRGLFHGDEELSVALSLLCMMTPPLLLLYLFYTGNGYWLGAIFALGAASGGTIATMNLDGPGGGGGSGRLPPWANGWHVAVAFSFATMVGFHLASPCRTRHFIYLLSLSAFMLLITPWLKRIPWRVPGFTASCFLAEIIAAAFAFIATALAL